MHHRPWKSLATATLLVLAIALPGAAWATGGAVTDDAEVLAPPSGAVPLSFNWNPYPQVPNPDAILYDNGPLVNAPGGGAGGADGSVLQTAIGLNTYGFGNQVLYGYRMADDFTITQPSGWQIDSIAFYAYQTNSTTTSTMTAVHLQIWNGDPSAGGSVVWGDLTTNRLASTAWSNAYRYSDTTPGTTRPIMRNEATVGTILLPGTYWLDWETDGTLSSGPWAPPITINGVTVTGNALQYTTDWAPAIDTGTAAAQQGMPFVIYGSLVAPSAVNVTGVQAQAGPSPLWLFAAVFGLVLAGALVARRARA